MKLTPLYEFMIGPLALACVIAVLVGVALEAPDDAAPVGAVTSGSAAP